MQFKLQNVLIEDTQRVHNYQSLYVRTNMPLLFQDKKSIIMPAHSRFDFSTYFGSLSIKKWARYTKANNFHLRIRIRGKFTLSLMSYINDTEYNIAARSRLAKHDCDVAEITDCDFDIPISDADVVSFEIVTLSECFFEYAYYWTDIEEELVKDVDLGIVSPTYKKESYVLKNITLFDQLLQSDEDIADHLQVIIVDNGRSLPEDAASNIEQIHIFKNINAGGAGGFARGMIEAMKLPKEPTHLLVMDDDVSVSLESFIRTFNLLRIVDDEYSDAFISGAMLSMQLQDKQVEDVGNIFLNGTFGAIKQEKFLVDMNQVVANETVRCNRQRQYAAFWYCCFSMETVHKQGLPMPFFVRGDDAEFGLRKQDRKFITMNGICVWHMSFGHSKFNCVNECYLAIRNLLIISAITPSCYPIDTYNCLFKQNFETEIRKFNYDYCDLMLDGIEDYLKGPVWLGSTPPDPLMQSKFAKKPKYIHFKEALPSEAGRLYDDGGALSIFKKAKMKFTHNGHVGMTDDQMDPTPGSMLNEFGTYHEARLYMHKEMYFINDDMETGYTTHIDRDRYSKIIERLKRVEKEYLENHERVAQEWRDAHTFLTSKEFWEGYLGIDQE